MVAASEQPASRSGSSTRFVGDRIAAVSAMKCTPAKMITLAGVRGRLPRQAERVAHEIGDVLHLGPLVVVREHDRVPLARQPADLPLQLGDLLGRLRGRLDDRELELPRRRHRASGGG